VSVWDFVRDPASVRLLVEFGESRGLAASSLLDGTGLQRRQLDDPNLEIDASQELLVVTHLLRALDHPPCLGLEVGGLYRFTTYGIWGYGLISSATAGEAMALALRFLPLTYAFTRIAGEQANGQFILKFGEPELDDEIRRFLVQRDLVAATRLMSDLVGPDFRLHRVMLREPQPAIDIAALPALCEAPIEFGCEMNALVGDTAVLSARMPNANAVTAAMCKQTCEALMARRRIKQGVSTLIRACLQAASGPDLPDLAHMAHHLCMSERTLKRRLHEENTSFRQILLDVRQQAAQDLLAKGTLSMSEIASRLGFSDPSSFSQAFKRWHGVPPSLAQKIK
jgi:AraC-like DNA-binding protein